MKERILAAMNAAFGIDNASEETSQKNCAEWDSLHHLDLILNLEDEFDLSFEPEEIAEMIDYPAVEAMVKQKIQ